MVFIGLGSSLCVISHNMGSTFLCSANGMVLLLASSNSPFFILLRLGWITYLLGLIDQVFLCQFLNSF